MVPLINIKLPHKEDKYLPQNEDCNVIFTPQNVKMRT